MSALPPTAVQPLVENLFRREAGKLTSALTRFFGSKHLELAEDVVQETLIKAMHEWPFKGIPDDPVAWLHRVARNGVIDRLRRDARGLELIGEHRALLKSEWTLTSTVAEALDPQGISDDQLRMMFACCHRSLPEEQQVALALKTLCGFSVPEIARAFLTNEENINKRLYRAREAFRELGRLEIPGPNELGDRLEQVLSVIYLLFNEGYHSVSHDELIREDLIEEAMHLCALLLDNEATAQPQVHALLALMCFHASRTGSRTGADGTIQLLEHQDRSRWDQRLIAKGNEHLTLAADGERLTAYHVEAAIAGLYANPATYADTDWRTIAELYDVLLRFKPAPLVRINRAIAIGKARSAEDGLRELDVTEEIKDHNLYNAAKGDLLVELGRNGEARACYEAALRVTVNEAESELIRMKIERL